MESKKIEQADSQQNGSPPDACMQPGKHNLVRRRLEQLINARRQNQRSIDQQREPHEEPDRDGIFRFHQFTRK